jgi:hypothetical protein
MSAKIESYTVLSFSHSSIFPDLVKIRIWIMQGRIVGDYTGFKDIWMCVDISVEPIV